MFLNGYKVGKTLQRVAGGSFHTYYRHTGIFYKLAEDFFRVVVLFALEFCESYNFV